MRAPLYPVWWTGEGELHADLVDIETTEGRDGKAVSAYVLLARLPTKGIDNWNDRYTVGVGDPVRLEVTPALAKLASYAQNDTIHWCIVHMLTDRGRTRIIVDLSKEGVPRDQYKPPTTEPAAQAPNAAAPAQTAAQPQA